MLAKVEEKTEKKQPRKGGRPKGRKNNRTLYREAAIAAMVETQQRKGGTPLDFLLKVMNDQEAPLDKRIDAAKAAANYVHPKLVSQEHSGEVNVTHEDALSALE